MTAAGGEAAGRWYEGQWPLMADSGYGGRRMVWPLTLPRSRRSPRLPWNGASGSEIDIRHPCGCFLLLHCGMMGWRDRPDSLGLSDACRVALG